MGLLALVIALLCISAFVSGSETAFFSLSPADINKIKANPTRANNTVLRLMSMQDYLLATILITNNLVNICIVILSNAVLDIVMSFNTLAVEFVVKTVIVTFLLLLFGEIMPKIFSAYNPLKFARFAAVPLMGLKHLMKPFAYLLIGSGNVINNRLASKKSNISIDQLSDAMEITTDHTDEERQMLSGIVGFVNTEAVEIMKLRMDIVSLDITADFATVKKTFIESGFSRIPVYEDTLDNIKGILYVKDMTPFIGQSDDFYWQSHLRKAYFVPEHKKINDLLEEFRSHKVHMAIVVDEYGGTQGLVSLEDILEEIVGEITDESDIEEPTYYKKLDDDNFVFEGKTHLSDFEKVLGLGEDYFSELCGGTETVAGLVLELKHDFLKVGESIESKGVKFTVQALDGRRIDKVKIKVDRAKIV